MENATGGEFGVETAHSRTFIVANASKTLFQ